MSSAGDRERISFCNDVIWKSRSILRLLRERWQAMRWLRRHVAPLTSTKYRPRLKTVARSSEEIVATLPELNRLLRRVKGIDWPDMRPLEVLKLTSYPLWNTRPAARCLESIIDAATEEKDRAINGILSSARMPSKRAVSKAGRKRRFDPAVDARLYRDVKASGVTVKEYVRQRGGSVRAVGKSMARHRANVCRSRKI